MRTAVFQWGPLARGIYIAMLWLTILVGWHFSHWLYHYVALLIFLGFCLKPLLQALGLDTRLADVQERLQDGRWRRLTRKRRARIARNERDKQYRQRRHRDKSLPDKW